MNIIIILLILILFLLLLVINYYLNITYENFQGTNDTLIIQTAKEVTLLEKTKKENDKIKADTNKLKEKKDQLEKQIINLDQIIKNKEKEKTELENDISKINEQRNVTVAVASALSSKIDNTIQKEEELKRKEEELKKKTEETSKIANIMDKQTNDKILSLLELLKKETSEIKNTIIEDEKFCKETKEIPKPIFKSYSKDEKDLTYNWCMCNDINKNSIPCKNYLECKANYDNNLTKDKLTGNDLSSYLNCLELYKEFPKYMIK